MKRHSHSFVDLTALPQVGALLLDPRPVWLWSDDGSQILWANAAGVSFLGAATVRDLIGRAPARASLALQIADLGARLRIGEPEMALLRLDGAAAQLCLATRVPVDDEDDGILVASQQPPAVLEPLAGRALALTETLAEADVIAAVSRADGRLVAASPGLDALADAGAALAELGAATSGNGRRILKRRLMFGPERRLVGITVATTAEGEFRLALIGPAESGTAAEPAAPSAPPPAALASEAHPVRQPPVAAGSPGVDRQAEADSPFEDRDFEIEPTPILPDRPFGRHILSPAARRRSEDHGDQPPVAPPPERDALPAAAANGNEAVAPDAIPDAAAAIGPMMAALLRSGTADAEAPTATPAAGREPPAETSPEPTAEARAPERFLFRPRPAPIRFVFHLDDDHRFTQVSPELATVVGPRQAAIVGRTWNEVATELGFAAADAVEQLLTRRDTWSGVTVYWPIQDSSDAVAVDLAALPAFTRGGGFEGFRGFGVCRTRDLRNAGPPPDADTLPPPVEEKATTPPIASSNVVRLAAVQPTRERNLSGNEQDAFRRIAEALRNGTPKASPREVTAGVKDRPSPPPAEPEASDRKDVAAPSASPPEVATAVPAPPAAEAVTLRFLDRLPLGLLVFRDRSVLFANRPLLERLGYGDRDLLAEQGGLDILFATAAEAGESGGRPGRVHLRAADGEDVAVEAKLHIVPWADGSATMLSTRLESDASRRAIEDHKAALARIDELEAVLDTATDGVLVLDAEARIMSVNRSAEALFGVEATDVLGTPFPLLLAEESRRSAMDYLDGLARNGVASVLNDGREVIGRTPAGGLIPMFMTMGRLAEPGKFCAVLRDITQWKNAEEELIAARRSAELANQQKSDFLARISHEIRTPLNAIIGFSEVMLEERFGPIGVDRYRDYLKDIRLSGSHLMSLINDLLDLSKIEAGKLDLAFTAVPVNEILQECVALMQPEANRRRIIIRTSLGAAVPRVVADERSLRQIVLNLLSNAVKFTFAGGQVIVSSALDDNGEVVIRIRDTGIGMSERDLETALKPFRQVSTTHLARSEGTGLGLPLTKALVEANRAVFTIDSTPNQGTMARITFPTSRVLPS